MIGLTYSYNKAGNRTKVGGSFARTGIPSAITSAAYNAANQQTALGGKTMTFDNNGNLTSITDASGTTIYSWNARNQLTGISGPGVTASFVYDGLGRREKKTVNSGLTEFLYDGVNPVQETSGATVLANILTGLGIDEFFSRTDVPAATTSHFLPDALGSTIALADGAGSVQSEYTYEPFGRTTATGASNSNPFQFTGRDNDGTGLYYYRARYYHPQLQRFISEDPWECQRRAGRNLFAYVDNNPLGYIDPFGLDKKPPCNRPWDQCYTNCINTLAPGFLEGLIGTNILTNLGSSLADEVFVTIGDAEFPPPSNLKHLFPKLGRFGSLLGKWSFYIQGALGAWTAGVSYGCMISCLIDPCSY